MASGRNQGTFLGDSLQIDDIRVHSRRAGDDCRGGHRRCTGYCGEIPSDRAAATVAGIRNVMVIPTGDTRPSSLDGPSQTAAKSSSTAPSKSPQDLGLPPVVIAVASGKGGSGSQRSRSIWLWHYRLWENALGFRMRIFMGHLCRAYWRVHRKVVPDKMAEKLSQSWHRGSKPCRWILVEEVAAHRATVNPLSK